MINQTTSQAIVPYVSTTQFLTALRIKDHFTKNAQERVNQIATKNLGASSVDHLRGMSEITPSGPILLDESIGEKVEQILRTLQQIKRRIMQQPLYRT